MKKIFLGALPLVFLFSSAFNPSAGGRSEKIFIIFNETFNNVQDLKWYIADKEYVAYFYQNKVKTKITYDENGKYLRSRRELSEEYLPLNILCYLKDKFSGKAIKSVTEVGELNETVYSINVEDEKNIWVIESFPNGSIKQMMKFKKQI